MLSLFFDEREVLEEFLFWKSELVAALLSSLFPLYVSSCVDEEEGGGGSGGAAAGGVTAASDAPRYPIGDADSSSS